MKRERHYAERDSKSNSTVKGLLRAGVVASAFVLAGCAWAADYGATTAILSSPAHEMVDNMASRAIFGNPVGSYQRSIDNYVKSHHGNTVSVNGVVVSLRPIRISDSVARDGLGGELFTGNHADTYNVTSTEAFERLSGYINTFGGTATGSKAVFNIEHLAGSKEGYDIGVRVHGKRIYVEQLESITNLKPGERVTVFIEKGNHRDIPAVVVPRS